MKRRNRVAMLAALVAASCAVGDEEHAVVGVVLGFNEAVTQQSMDSALAFLAPGGVQFNLHPSHAGMGGDAELTQDLRGLWGVVGPVLFSTLESYTRVAEVLDVEVNGDVATVWTSTTTTTLEQGATTPSVLEFTEAFMLVRSEGAWLIAGVANNRPSTAP